MSRFGLLSFRNQSKKKKKFRSLLSLIVLVSVRSFHNVELSGGSCCWYYTQIIDFSCINRVLDTVPGQVVQYKSSCNSSVCMGLERWRQQGKTLITTRRQGCIGNVPKCVKRTVS
jgi:hypothetical protein